MPTTPPSQGAIWHPGTQPIEWQWMIDHALNTSSPSDMGYPANTYTATAAGMPTVYDIDLFMNPASTITTLHDMGDKVICYMDGGAYESYRPDAASFPKADIGNSTGWNGEYWLNTTDIAGLAPIMSARLDMAVQKGCDGVEVDQMDGWSNNSGFKLNVTTGEAWDSWFLVALHGRKLTAVFKNQIEIAGWASSQGWDAALNEQCNQYSECSGYPPDGGLPAFHNAGKAVFQVEYKRSASSFCPADNAADYNGMLMPLNLNGGRTPCR
jgi:hypothetical protein